MKLLTLYNNLLEEYGKQQWWRQESQLSCAPCSKSRTSGPADSPYEVVVGAILTQNTNWKNVEKAITNLKKASRISPEKILKIPDSKLETLIRPSGFYRQKAERLKLATKKWLTINSKLEILELREEWLSVKGIGKETADTILLYAMNKPIFVIDAYTRRFCKINLNKEFKEYDDYRIFFEKNLPKDLDLYKEYHALIVQWGKTKHPKDL
ncbi:endonuclease [Candidatus Micrarchaeota archaeon]|nr:endonuclease [Candidatus Micrarchaeota archaeon]